MNTIKHTKYLQYLANPEQKIYKIDKVEKKTTQLHKITSY